MAHIEIKTEAELKDDWQAILDAEEDARVTVDTRLRLEDTWIEQTNNSRGVDAEGNFPVERKIPSPGVQRFIDSVGDDC